MYKNSCKAIVEISSNQARVNEKASMRAVAKILQHEQVSARVIFASSSSKGQNLRALYIEWDHSIPLLNSGITLPHFDISLLKYNSRGWALIKAVQNDFENLLSCFLCCVAVGDHSRGQNDDSNAKFSLKNSPSDTNEINK